jgi:hypothetical protein
MLEVIVSLTLLMTVLSVSLPLIFRHSQLLVAQRHYRQALDELSNQLDRLTSLAGADLDKALKQLSPSPFVVARLSNVKLEGESKPDDTGQRVTLQLTWNDPHEERVTMTGWLFPVQDAAARRSEP